MKILQDTLACNREHVKKCLSPPKKKKLFKIIIRNFPSFLWCGVNMNAHIVQNTFIYYNNAAFWGFF